MPKLLIFDAFTMLICEKIVANYALLRYKTFSLKIWLCKFFDKFHVWLEDEESIIDGEIHMQSFAGDSESLCSLKPGTRVQIWHPRWPSGISASLKMITWPHTLVWNWNTQCPKQYQSCPCRIWIIGAKITYIFLILWMHLKRYE